MDIWWLYTVHWYSNASNTNRCSHRLSATHCTSYFNGYGVRSRISIRRCSLGKMGNQTIPTNLSRSIAFSSSRFHPPNAVHYHLQLKLVLVWVLSSRHPWLVSWSKGDFLAVGHRHSMCLVGDFSYSLKESLICFSVTQEFYQSSGLSVGVFLLSILPKYIHVFLTKNVCS